MAARPHVLLYFLATFLALFLVPSQASTLPSTLAQRGTIPSLSGSASSLGAGTYPRATRLSDGSLLGVYTAFSGDTNIITVVISHDNGASWQPQGEVTRGVGDIDNPFPIQLPSGRALVAFRNHSRANGNTGAYTYFRITICYSDNLGRNWQYLSQPASDPGPTNGNWEPFMRLSSTGALQLYYSREVSGSDQDNLVRTSTDGGLTWSLSTIVSGSGLNVRDGMVGVASVGTGRNLIAVFETGINGAFTVNSVTSSDDGATWGNRRVVYSSPASGANAGAPQVVNVGGTLVASFMTNEDTSARDWPNSSAVKVLTSTDGGVSWQRKTTVFPVASYWSGMLALDNNSLLVVADHGGAKSQRVVLN